MRDEPWNECRFLVHPPGDGAWNMAVDEYLLGWTSRTKRSCWRFYEWREPTLSLGYFQQHMERAGHEASRSCPLVRRASGGGAILHDNELTYCLTLPADHPLARRRQWTYDAVHRSLIAVLAEWGIEAGMFGDTEAGKTNSGEFLCFQRRSPGDVLVQGSKIAGSAQRRAADAVLQHGSILLSRSASAPELAGLLEISGQGIESGDLAERWQQHLGKLLQFQWWRDDLAQGEEFEIQRIVADKYGHSDWNEKRRH